MDPVILTLSIYAVGLLLGGLVGSLATLAYQQHKHAKLEEQRRAEIYLHRG
jgi:hypothetical protein